MKLKSLGMLTLNMRNVGCNKDDVTYLKNKLYHGKQGKPFVSLKLLAWFYILLTEFLKIIIFAFI